MTDFFSAQLEREAVGTRRALERVPDGRPDWKPHEKSMPLGYLSTLVATIPSWIAMQVTQDELDLAPPGGGGYKPPATGTTRELLQAFDDSVAAAREALRKTTDEHLATPWRLLVAGQVVLENPRDVVVADTFMHLAHHRGQLDRLSPAERRAGAGHLRTVGRRPAFLAGRTLAVRSDSRGRNEAMRQRPRVGPDKVGPEDPRYADLVRRGFNKRFAGKPDFVRLVGSTEQVVDAVQEAVRDRLRVVVRSGGHCLEGFVADPAVRVVIDTSLMTDVYYDPEMAAFAVEAGTTLGEAYRKLFLGWGVTIPAGESPNIGIGGHVLGGAFGFLCRQHGLAADHLYGIELVVVDEAGTARSVVATREPSDPNRDLWWAHTGGGGGNFGVVTRYWFRSPGASGTDPALLLPKAPDSTLTFRVAWNWEDIDEAAFTRLVRNFGDWCEHNSDADSPCARLFSTLFLWRRQFGKLEMRGLSTGGGEAERLFDEHLAAINDGVGVPHTRRVERSSWLTFALNPFPELFQAVAGGALLKGKDAFLRKRFTDRQIEVAYRYLTRTDHDVAGGMMGLATYGGKVNTVAPDATASAQRDSILTTSCSAGWGDLRDEARSVAWVRAFYRDLFADTGGVPVPGDVCDGAMINHPDVDLADPEWNTSGVPWHALYYKDNYPRLQRIKTRWDPRDVFHHALSIRPA